MSIATPFIGTYQDDITRELVVDNFAGGGGASTGIELALGRPVDIAINHSEAAIQMHTVNHPLTKHYQEDVFAIDPEQATEGRPVGIGWFSPDCTFFSKARGGKPVEKKIRGLAWVTIKWAMSSVAPRVIFLENVEEFKEWGPCKEVVETKGKHKGEKVWKPDADRKAETFNGFVSILTTGISKTHPAFLECCDFLRLDPEGKEANKLSRGLGYKADWRILKACDYGAPTIRKRFYLCARRDGQPIVFPEPTHGKALGLKPYRTAAECIDFSRPCPSIFTRKNPLVVNTLKRIARGMRKFVLENPEPFIMQMNFENAPQRVDSPLTTLTTGNHHYLMDPFLTQYHKATTEGEVRGQKVDEPLMTVDGANRYGLASAFLTKYFSGEDQAGASLDNPAPTVTGIDHSGLVSLHLSHRYGDGEDGRGSAVDEPMRAVTGTPHSALMATNIIHYYGGDDHASDPAEPLPTITAKPRHYLVAHHLCVLRNNMGGVSVKEPLSTITSGAAHHANVAVYLQKIDTTQDLGQWAKVRDLLNKYAGFDFTIADDEIIIIEIDRQQYFISDVGMRMLEPDELILAQGAPKDYVIDIERFIGKKYNKQKQIERIGNMVCSPVAEALVRANCKDMIMQRKVDTMHDLHRVFSGTLPRAERQRKAAV